MPRRLLFVALAGGFVIFASSPAGTEAMNAYAPWLFPFILAGSVGLSGYTVWRERPAFELVLVATVVVGTAVVHTGTGAAGVAFAYALSCCVETAVHRRARRALHRSEAAFHTLSLSKSTAQRFIDIVTRWLPPGTAVAACIVAVGPPFVFETSFAFWLYRGLLVLFLGRIDFLKRGSAVIQDGLTLFGRRCGLVVVGDDAPALLARVDAVLLNKHFLLPEGQLQVADVIALGEWTEKDVVTIGAAMQWDGKHPVGTAVVAAAQQLEVPIISVDERQEHPGGGVKATVDGQTFRLGTVRFLRRESVDVAGAVGTLRRLQREEQTVIGLAAGLRLVGLIVLTGIPSERSVNEIRRLTRLSRIKRIGIVTEIDDPFVRRTAHDVNVHPVRTDGTVEGKVAAIKQWQRKGYRVAYVGDGRYDAAAIKAADQGIGMHFPVSEGGAFSPKQPPVSSGVFLTGGGGNTSLVDVIRLSRRASTALWLNLFIVVAFKSFVVLTLVTGSAGLNVVIMGEMAASLLVSANGLRFLR